MSLNANKIKASQGNRVVQEVLEPGAYPARLVQVISLGTQKERPYLGEEKPPRLHLMLTYEFLDEFIKDEEGNLLKDKPRFLSEEIPFLSLKADKAKSTLRYFALDPEQKAKGDWAKLVGSPCMLTIVNEQSTKDPSRIFEKIASVSAMRPKEVAKAPELINPPKIFDFYDPDLEVFNSLPEWLQNKMKDAVDYEGSKLQELLGERGKPRVDLDPPKEDEDEENITVSEDEENW